MGCAVVSDQDEALLQFNATSCSQRNTNQLDGNNVDNDKVCLHDKQ